MSFFKKLYISTWEELKNIQVHTIYFGNITVTFYLPKLTNWSKLNIMERTSDEIMINNGTFLQKTFWQFLKILNTNLATT
jgi:hypothetical protein